MATKRPNDLSGRLVLNFSDENIEEVVNAERAVLIFTKSDCGHCAAYQAEIEALCQQGEMEGVNIGKVVLNQRGITRYKRENPWLSSLRFLPYTLLYSEGQPVDDFAASKGAYLLERIESAFTVREYLYSKNLLTGFDDFEQNCRSICSGSSAQTYREGQARRQLVGDS